MAQHFHKTLGWLSGVVVLRCFVVVCAALWHGGDFGDAAPVPVDGLVEYRGTRAYRSPEMAAFQRYGVKTDIFSLGIVGREFVEQDCERCAKAQLKAVQRNIHEHTKMQLED